MRRARQAARRWQCGRQKTPISLLRYRRFSSSGRDELVFEESTVARAAHMIEAALSAAAVPEPALSARYLVAHAIGKIAEFSRRAFMDLWTCTD